jgi:hypothetical protein
VDVGGCGWVGLRVGGHAHVGERQREQVERGPQREREAEGVGRCGVVVVTTATVVKK